MAAATASSSLQELSTSNDHITMTVSVPSTGQFCSPCLVQPVIACRDESRYSHFDLSLVAFANIVIMGKRRWQVGQLANAGFGPTSAVLVTTMDKVEFMNVKAQWKAHSETSANVDKKGKASEGMSGRWQVDVPPVPDRQLLPSWTKLDGLESDPAGVEIVYRLKLVAHRPGMLKRAESLSLVLPFAQRTPLPRAPPPTAVQKSLKFDGAPKVDISFSYFYRAPRHLCCDVSLSPPDAIRLLEGESNLSVSIALTRKTRTTPVQDPSKGRSFDWAPIQVLTAPLERARSGEFRWSGKVEMPEREKTVESPSLAVHYVVACVVKDKAFEHGYAKTSLPIFLPSTKWDEADAPPADGDQLPSYGA